MLATTPAVMWRRATAKPRPRQRRSTSPIARTRNCATRCEKCSDMKFRKGCSTMASLRAWTGSKVRTARRMMLWKSVVKTTLRRTSHGTKESPQSLWARPSAKQKSFAAASLALPSALRTLSSSSEAAVAFRRPTRSPLNQEVLRCSRRVRCTRPLKTQTRRTATRRRLGCGSDRCATRAWGQTPRCWLTSGRARLGGAPVVACPAPLSGRP
mmetsp:Transcript_112370/g.317588  ORF Transcript_112370/g.317588 Transcript_112370/m.317588 type:complete len:212 (-) Transcript_112370:915-1550(-)